MPDWLNGLAAEPYEARGIIHSEIALIIDTVRRLGITRIIESGRARGQSTYLLAKYMPDVEVHSIELRPEHGDEQIAQERLKDFANVSLYTGDAVHLIPTLLGLFAPDPTAILLDGPKGAAAVGILERSFVKPQVRVGFIHDMRKLDHGGPSPHRQAAVDRLPLHKFSDDPSFVAASSWMDAKVAEAGGPCGPQHEAVFGSYGPTLGVFLNHKHKAESLTHVLFSKAG